MKTFTQYLVESEKTYKYRIKIVGDVDSGFEKEFKDQLKKYDPVSVKETKKTPIMSRPTDFPEHANQPVNIIDVEFRYPATPPQIQQITNLLGVEEGRVCVSDLKWSEGMDTELLGIEEQPEVLLTSEYPENSKEQKEVSSEYAAYAHEKAVVKNSASGAAWTVAGGTTPPAVTTDHLPQGVKSPMTDIKRPPRPEVGKKTKD